MDWDDVAEDPDGYVEFTEEQRMSESEDDTTYNDEEIEKAWPKPPDKLDMNMFKEMAKKEEHNVALWAIYSWEKNDVDVPDDVLKLAYQVFFLNNNDTYVARWKKYCEKGMWPKIRYLQFISPKLVPHNPEEIQAMGAEEKDSLEHTYGRFVSFSTATDYVMLLPTFPMKYGKLAKHPVEDFTLSTNWQRNNNTSSFGSKKKSKNCTVFAQNILYSPEECAVMNAAVPLMISLFPPEVLNNKKNVWQSTAALLGSKVKPKYARLTVGYKKDSIDEHRELFKNDPILEQICKNLLNCKPMSINRWFKDQMTVSKKASRMPVYWTDATILTKAGFSIMPTMNEMRRSQESEKTRHCWMPPEEYKRLHEMMGALPMDGTWDATVEEWLNEFKKVWLKHFKNLEPTPKLVNKYNVVIGVSSMTSRWQNSDVMNTGDKNKNIRRSRNNENFRCKLVPTSYTIVSFGCISEMATGATQNKVEKMTSDTYL